MPDLLGIHIPSVQEIEDGVVARVVGPLEDYVKSHVPDLVPKLGEIRDTVEGILKAGLKEAGGDLSRLPALVADVEKALANLKLPGAEQLAGVVFEALLRAADPFLEDLLPTLPAKIPHLLPHLDRVIVPLGPNINAALRSQGFKEIAALENPANAIHLIAGIRAAVLRRDIIFKEGVTLQEILDYGDYLVGLEIAVWSACFAFAAILSPLTGGTDQFPFTGFLLHILSEWVGDARRVVETVIFRKAIADPLTLGLQRIHRTEAAATGELDQAFVAGFIDLPEYRAGLAGLGHSDHSIQLKAQLAAQKRIEFEGGAHARVKVLSPSQVLDVFKAGLVTEDDAHERLGKAGLVVKDVKLLLDLHRPKAKVI